MQQVRKNFELRSWGVGLRGKELRAKGKGQTDRRQEAVGRRQEALRRKQKAAKSLTIFKLPQE